MRHPQLRALAVLLIGIAGVCQPFGASPALAHNSLESSTPTNGESLESSPSTWTLRFTKPVPLESASGEFIDSTGVRSPLGPPVHGADENVIVFSLPENVIGAVTTRWRLVGVDGHIISGRVMFSVAQVVNNSDDPAAISSAIGETVPPEFELVEPPPPIPSSVSYLLRLVELIFLMGLIGVVFVELQLAQGSSATRAGSLFLRVGSVGIVITASLQALSFAAELREVSLFGSFGGIPDAFGTTPGAMLFLQAIIAIVLAFQLWSASWQVQRSTTTGIVIVMALYLLARAFTGHARSEGVAIFGIPLDMLHTVSSAVWLGGLVAVIVCIAPSVSDDVAITVFDRFGRGANVAVPVIVLTGTAQTLNMHGGLGTILTSTHGRVLLVKILLVMVMLVLGNTNRRRLRSMPESRRGQQKHLRNQLVRTSLTESAVGIVVVAVTAILVTSSLG